MRKRMIYTRVMKFEGLGHWENKLDVLQGCEAEARWLQLGILLFSPYCSPLKTLQSIPCSKHLQWDFHGAAGLGVSGQAFWSKKKPVGIRKRLLKMSARPDSWPWLLWWSSNIKPGSLRARSLHRSSSLHAYTEICWCMLYTCIRKRIFRHPSIYLLRLRIPRMSMLLGLALLPNTEILGCPAVPISNWKRQSFLRRCRSRNQENTTAGCMVARLEEAYYRFVYIPVG